MAEYRTVTAEATVINKAISATVSVVNAVVSVGATIETAITQSEAERYEGAYTVIPDWTTQTLETANRYLTDDVEVKPIPCESVSNLSGGRTVYIGGII